MHFDLNEETVAMQDMARKFGEKEVTPRIEEDEFKRDLVERMGELGLFGCAFPARFGGVASGFLAHSVVCEEISRADSGLRALFNLQAMFAVRYLSQLFLNNFNLTALLFNSI